MNAVNRDAFLTDVTLYWVTGTVGSSMRIYREENLNIANAQPLPRLEVPVAYAVFPKEFIAVPDRRLETGYHIVRKTVMPKGGHFPALEQPDVLIGDIRAFFATLKP